MVLQATKVQFLIQGFGSIREIKINQNIKFYLMSFQNTMKRLMTIIKKRRVRIPSIITNNNKAFSDLDCLIFFNIRYSN